jgi:hypothetical protein
MYVLGSCFHRCDQMMPSITMNSPRLSVVQNGQPQAIGSGARGGFGRDPTICSCLVSD